MTSNLPTVLATASALLVLAGTRVTLADTAVDVSLEDASEGGNLAGMKMTASPDSVKAIELYLTRKNGNRA